MILLSKQKDDAFQQNHRWTLSIPDEAPLIFSNSGDAIRTAEGFAGRFLMWKKVETDFSEYLLAKI